MAHDPVRVEETRSWFLKAQADLRGSEVDLAADSPLIEDALFHCQQAVEKALKGFLTWHDQPFRKTHNLIELGNQCSQIDHTLDSILHKAAKLTAYATIYRYPGLTFSPEAEEAASARALACEVLDAVLGLLPSETRP